MGYVRREAAVKELTAGARIAIERQTGWNRQLRLSALSPRAYIVSKSAVSLLVALPAILLHCDLAYCHHVLITDISQCQAGHPAGSTN